MTWNTQCKYAPINPLAKHCNKTNEGNKSQFAREMRAKQGKGPVGKGRWSCARHCRYLEGIE